MNNDLLNNIVFEKSNDILFSIVKQLEKIVNDLKNQKHIDIVIKQISNIIISMNNAITENRKNTEKLIKEINELKNTIKSNFEKIYCNTKKIYKDGEYVGRIKKWIKRW